jgi:glutathione S-transferase
VDVVVGAAGRATQARLIRTFVATASRSPTFPPLYRHFGIDIARPHVPNVERWYRALAERPAYRAHVMVPFAELEGRLEY